MNLLKSFVNRLLFPHTYNNEVFCKYLRSKGAKIGENTRFVAPKKSLVDEARLEYITIGDDCCFSHVSFIAHDYSWYVFKDAYNSMLPDCGGEIVIGNNVFIGYQSVVLKGTTIGDNVIIGARAVVKGIIPSNTVWAGVPAKFICTLDEYYEKKRKAELQDALFRRNIIIKKYNRNPSIGEMGWFSLLFLERTEENYTRYLRDLEFNGVRDSKKIRKYFFETQPKYSFEEFLKL